MVGVIYKGVKIGGMKKLFSNLFQSPSPTKKCLIEYKSSLLKQG